jgi:hypothetical protein
VQGEGFTVACINSNSRSMVFSCCSSSAGEGTGCQWCRLWGIGFGVWCLGFGVQNLGFGVRGMGFRIWGLGFGEA